MPGEIHFPLQCWCGAFHGQLDTQQLTAWHVRQFVKALDKAEIPDSALLNHRKAHDTLHLIELSAYREDVRE